MLFLAEAVDRSLFEVGYDRETVVIVLGVQSRVVTWAEMLPGVGRVSRVLLLLAVEVDTW